MQNHMSLVKDVRGCMTRFDPLTPEIVSAQSDDGLTYDELKQTLAEYGMSIDKVVFDGSRAFQNAFYADFEQGHYCWIPFQKVGLKAIIRTMNQQFYSPSFGIARKKREWESFYMMDVPLPMQIYDFERRYKDIEPDRVFSVWSSIHTHIDYSNGMWDPEVLNYVFSHAPKTDLPETDADGKVTIYRGMGEKSQPAEEAISWSTDPVCALWFANRSARGTRLVSARVDLEQILVYSPGYRAEHEVILKPGTKLIVQEDRLCLVVHRAVVMAVVFFQVPFHRLQKLLSLLKMAKAPQDRCRCVIQAKDALWAEIFRLLQKRPDLLQALFIHVRRRVHQNPKSEKLACGRCWMRIVQQLFRHRQKLIKGRIVLRKLLIQILLTLTGVDQAMELSEHVIQPLPGLF